MTAALANHVLVAVFIVLSLIREHMVTLIVYENLKICCFSFRTYKKQFVIHDPESLNIIIAVVKLPENGFWCSICVYLKVYQGLI